MPVTADSELIQHPDGRVELRDYDSVRSGPLYNEDLAPVPVAKRDWGTYNCAALWISMAHCIPTYMLAAGLSVGMKALRMLPQGIAFSPPRPLIWSARSSTR